MSISGLGLVTPPTSLAVDAPIPEIEGTFEIEFKLEFEPVILRLKSFVLSWPVTLRLRSLDCRFCVGLIRFVLFVVIVAFVTLVSWGGTPP